MLEETSVYADKSIFDEKTEQEFKMFPVFDETLINRINEKHFCWFVIQIMQVMASKDARRRQKQAWSLDIIENSHQFFESFLGKVLVFESESQALHRLAFLVLIKNIPKHIESSEEPKLLFLLTSRFD